ncbi:hypothetical protein [Adlercreutzia caecimuris]|uniref:hypothetical protein n=1 Tax=Adlercreutzia caecimuris TaxID=671266 RepID=UPI0024958341|nr:hypothetical protein [Adlercreutzia caecimuris]
MARRILCVLAVLMTALVCIGAVNEADLDERIRRNDSLNGMPSFAISYDESVDDSGAFYSALHEAAHHNGVNIFRKVSGWTFDNTPYTAYYADLNTGANTFFEAFSFVGDMPNVQYLEDMDWMMGTEDASADGERMGTIGDVAANDECVILPLKALFDSYSPAGTYYVEAADENDLDLFVSDLDGSFKALGFKSGVSLDLGGGWEAEGYDAGEVEDVLAPFLAQLAVFMLIVMVAYCQLRESKRSAILALYGSGYVRTWAHVSGRLLVALAIPLVVIAALATLFVRGATLALVVRTAGNVALAFGFVLIASFIVMFVTRPRQWVQALKGREGIWKLVAICFLAKAILCTMLIGMVGSTIVMWQALEEEQNRYGNWERASQYGIFAPLSVGFDGLDVGSGPCAAAITLDLYPKAVDNGALYVDALQYRPDALNDGTKYRSIVVNPNYLNRYPIEDAAGNFVNVEEGESDWVLLAPERYRNDEQGIRDWWRAQRDSLSEGDMVWCGRTVDDPPAGQAVRIIWTADDQAVFAFSPEVGVESAGNVTDPIVEVMTLANSYAFDRANAVTGGPEGALKVPLENGNTTQAYNQYRDLLAEAGLDDNVKQVVSMEGAVFETMRSFRDMLSGLCWQLVAVLVVTLFVSVQSASFLLEADGRRVAIRHLYGYGFFNRESGHFGVHGILWAATVGMVLLCNNLFGWPDGGQQLSLPILWTAVSAIALIDTLVFAGALFSVERKHVVDVLKGDR